jgi:hypothetical protein
VTTGVVDTGGNFAAGFNDAGRVVSLLAVSFTPVVQHALQISSLIFENFETTLKEIS